MSAPFIISVIIDIITITALVIMMIRQTKRANAAEADLASLQDAIKTLTFKVADDLVKLKTTPDDAVTS